MQYRHLAAIFVLLFVCLPSDAQERASQKLTVFAATSLTDVFEALKDEFLASNPGTDILLNFSSSSTLAAQLIQGAPADVFASANERQMDLVVEGGFIDEAELKVFAHNQLVLITPGENPAEVDSVRDLVDEGILLVLAAAGTPIRAYTDDMFVSYGGEYGADFVENVYLNLVSEESNVRQVVARVALGEADAGIVYQTDVIGAVSSQLRAIEIEPAHNQLASYPIAVLSDSANALLAARFVDFALSVHARSILAEFGFCTPAILSEESPGEMTPEPTLEAAEEFGELDTACQPRPPASG